MQRVVEYQNNNKDKIIEYRVKYNIENRDAKKEHRAKNKERDAQRQAQYYKENRELILNRNKEYRSNPAVKEAIRQKAAERRRYERLNNRDVVLRQEAQKRLKSKDRMAAYAAKWRKDHPEIGRAAKARRRARKRALPVSWAAQDQMVALSLWRGCCAYCGLSVVDDLFARVHWDHFIPLSKGGPTTPRNMIPSCDKCNLSKHDKDPREWLVSKLGEGRGVARMRAIEHYFASLKEMPPPEGVS